MKNDQKNEIFVDESGYEVTAELASLNKKTPHLSSVIITRRMWNESGTRVLEEQRTRITVKTAKRELALEEIQNELDSYIFDESLGGDWYSHIYVPETDVVEAEKTAKA